MPGSPVALAYDRVAEIYERARPGWPADAVDYFARALGLGRSAVVLDLGAGTGKLTRVLVERFDRVVAVEPLDRMRSVLESVVPLAEALAGEAERIPLPSQSVHAVFAADAFAWFNGGPALAEIARVLRPRGGLAILWNLSEKPTEPSISAAVELLGERGSQERNIDRYRSGEWRDPFASSPFDDLRNARFPHTQVVDREGMLAYLASMSWVAVLPDNERGRLLDEVAELLDAEMYTRFWRTELDWTRLAAEASSPAHAGARSSRSHGVS